MVHDGAGLYPTGNQIAPPPGLYCFLNLSCGSRVIKKDTQKAVGPFPSLMGTKEYLLYYLLWLNEVSVSFGLVKYGA